MKQKMLRSAGKNPVHVETWIDWKNHARNMGHGSKVGQARRAAVETMRRDKRSALGQIRMMWSAGEMVIIMPATISDTAS